MRVAARPIDPWRLEKPGGGHRTMACLHPLDEPRWLALARGAALHVERQLGPEVLANRWDVDEGRPRPFRPALQAARPAARRLAAGPGTVLLTDVREFYPSVRPASLNAALIAAGCRDVAEPAAAMLDAWGSEGYSGLPVGPVASTVLANALLVPVDEMLRGTGLPFLRWVDDYIVGVADPALVPMALERIDEALARVGLERARAKTRVLPARAVSRWPGRGYVPA